jgi:hypothetical protein
METERCFSQEALDPAVADAGTRVRRGWPPEGATRVLSTEGGAVRARSLAPLSLSRAATGPDREPGAARGESDGAGSEAVSARNTPPSAVLSLAWRGADGDDTGAPRERLSRRGALEHGGALGVGEAAEHRPEHVLVA